MTIPQIKRYSELQEDLKTAPFDGFPLINAQSYIPSTEVLGKILTNIKICAENQLILTHSCLGGRDFDKEHLAAKLKTEYKIIDVAQKKKASRTDCDKDLSGNTEANLNIKGGLMDYKGFLKRDELSFHAVEVILREFFILGYSECVVKGCATLAPTFKFKVEEFKVHVILPVPIALTWQQNGNLEKPIPSAKALTFYSSGTSTVDGQYADVSELQALAKMTIQATKGERQKVNLHGIVSVESAQLVEEEEVPVKKEAAKMDTDKAPADVNATDVEAPKKKVNIVDAVDKECEMVSVMDEKETYVFEMRNKLCEELGTESDGISSLPGYLKVLILDRVPIGYAVKTKRFIKRMEVHLDGEEGTGF